MAASKSSPAISPFSPGESPQSGWHLYAVEFQVEEE
jgi:hypothetical protein